MNIIKQNPFRILGLTGNATEKELQKQIGIIKRYAEVGKSKSFDYDFEFIGDFTRNSDEIQQASNSIEQAHKKLLYSLFWFVKNNQFDEIAFNNLKEKETDKAIEIWHKTLKEEITSKNYSSYLNLSTLYIALSTIDDQIELQKLQAGISLKGNLIHSENLKDFSKLVTGNGIANDPIEISKKFVDEVIELLKPYLNKTNGISTNHLISLFRTFPTSIQKYVSSKFTEIPISSIENKIEKTTRKRKDNPRDAEQHGEELYKSTKNDITLLKKLMDASNVQFQMLVDKVANEILQCSVDFFNDRQENDSDDNFETNLNTAIDLVKLAKSVAVSSQVKDRAIENINALIEMKDRVIHQAIALLKSVKDAFETNEAQIRRQVKIEELSLSFGQSINWSAVEEHIANSINWDEVNNLLITTLPNNNLKKIKESENNELKILFLELANWLRKKSLKNSTISNIINKYKKIPPKLPFKILSSNITNTDNKPLYTKFIRYIGLNLNVEVTKKTSLTFYLKYIKPDGSIKRNSDNSPKGYTRSETRELDINTRFINFSGWGNSDKCTYDIGEHRIEVYVEDHLIHIEKFVVDLAPSEKLEIDIKKLQNKLSQTQSKQFFKSDLQSLNYKISSLRTDLSNTKSKQYYSSELQNLNNQMTSIKEWKLFRGQETKTREISEQQKKVDNIIAKGKLKKEQDVSRIEEQIVIERREVKRVEAKAENEKKRDISIIEEQLLIKRRELNELINKEK